jgi:hypothetical protein
MSRQTRDLQILLCIAVPMTALMLLTPRENLRIERNWGAVIYSPPVKLEEANDLADLLVSMGLFSGNPISLKLDRRGKNWILMMASRRDYEEQIPRETLEAFGHELCSFAFPGKTASFVLIDTDFEPFDELVPPTLFPDS